jgi:hypothetical protein
MASNWTDLKLRTRVRFAVWLAILLARALFRLLRVVVRRALEALLAVVIVFEEWGWRPLADALGRLARLAPFAWVERQIQRLPPYGALMVFAMPSLLVLPLKLVSLWLIGSGRVLAAGALFLAAKVVGTALIARLFIVTQPQLMRIGWFKRAYDVVMPWKNNLVAWVRTTWGWRYGRLVKARIKHVAGPLVADIKARARMLIERLWWRA